MSNHSADSFVKLDASLPLCLFKPVPVMATQNLTPAAFWSHGSPFMCSKDSESSAYWTEVTSIPWHFISSQLTHIVWPTSPRQRHQRPSIYRGALGRTRRPYPRSNEAKPRQSPNGHCPPFILGELSYQRRPKLGSESCFSPPRSWVRGCRGRPNI